MLSVLEKILKFKQKKTLLNKDLSKGDLVETTYNDYVPINMIGVSQIYNSGVNKRIKDRLYKYTSNEYPHITKD